MARVVVFCISPPTPEGSEQCREGEGRVQEVSEAIASTHHTGTGHLNLPLHRRKIVKFHSKTSKSART